MVRREDKRNIRVWFRTVQTISRTNGAVALHQPSMANSLKFRDYDFHFSFGNGSHTRNGGHAELPEELVWLWRDYDAAMTQQTYTMEPSEKRKPYFRVKALNRE